MLSDGAHWGFLPVWVAAVAAAVWIAWRPGLHLAALSLGFWLVPLGFFVLDRHAHWLIALIGDGYRPGCRRRRPRHRPPAIALRMRCSPMASRWPSRRCSSPQFIDDFSFFDSQKARSVGRLLLLAVLTLAGLLAAMYWALHTDNRGALWIGYAAFAVEIYALYWRTLGTLLDTSLFFLVAAILVSALAWVAYLLHQRKRPARSRRMTASRKLLLALAIVALAQTGVLASMVVDRTLLLKTGREIILPIVPVDPRDLFRGEYVRLGYDINTVPAMLLVGPPPARNAAFYVTLEKNRARRMDAREGQRRQAQRDQSRPHRAEGPVADFHFPRARA